MRKLGDDVALVWKPQGKMAVVFFSQSKVGNTRQIAANIQLMIASVTVYPSSEFAFT